MSRNQTRKEVDEEEDIDLAMEESQIALNLEETEEELEKIKKILEEADEFIESNGKAIEDQTIGQAVNDSDSRSIWIGNVDYGASAEELEVHFVTVGKVSRVSIQCDKFTGHPKGFAYLEFENASSVNSALELDGSLFRGRAIQVIAKRTNRPGISTTNRPPLRTFRHRGSYRGGYFPRGGMAPIRDFRPRGMASRGGYRSRGGFRAWRARAMHQYAPY